jgi:hypothetical protein
MIQKTKSRHSSESNEHFTPPEIVEAARSTLGAIDLDPASCLRANEISVKARGFYSKANNGFVQPWHGRVFLNPPGGICDFRGVEVHRVKGHKGAFYEDGSECKGPVQSSAKAWWFKLVSEFHLGRVSAAIFLGFSIEILQTTQVNPASQELLGGGPGGILPHAARFPLCIPSRRISFLSIDSNGFFTPKSGNTHASVIVFVHPHQAPDPFDRFEHFFDGIGHVKR